MEKTKNANIKLATYLGRKKKLTFDLWKDADKVSKYDKIAKFLGDHYGFGSENVTYTSEISDCGKICWEFRDYAFGTLLGIYYPQDSSKSFYYTNPLK